MPGSQGSLLTLWQTPFTSCGQPQLPILAPSIHATSNKHRVDVTAVTGPTFDPHALAEENPRLIDIVLANDSFRVGA
jgi:hypothetical protein